MHHARPTINPARWILPHPDPAAVSSATSLCSYLICNKRLIGLHEAYVGNDEYVYSHSRIQCSKQTIKSEYKHSLTFRVWCYVVKATKPVTDWKSAQQCATRGHPLPFPKIHPGPCGSVVWACREGQTYRQTHSQTHRRQWPNYISRRLRLTRNVTRGHSVERIPSLLTPNLPLHHWP